MTKIKMMNKEQVAKNIAFKNTAEYFNDIIAAGGDKPKLRVLNSDDEAHIYLYDTISSWWGITAKDIIDALADANGKDVVLHINCYGGEVFEARAMYSAIKDYSGTVRAQIDGVCASAATYVAIACENISMIDGGIFMIHNASGICWGDHNDMIKQSEILLKISEGIADDYVAQTGKSKDDILQLMDDETYMTADEALEDGFIDEIKDLKASESDDDENETSNDGEIADEPENSDENLHQLQAKARMTVFDLSAHNA
ncbi:MAG: Clp protease ClpP [Rhizobiales bacterium]|nr:Clp protease ClpP [Hyphomicrobiales bacterium]NRB15035.1 Clp protease ClpP [Hyphomicrobiales bacterium]